MSDTTNHSSLNSINRTLDTEIAAMNVLRHSVNNDQRISFLEMINFIHKLQGRLIVTGMGKSGHVATKLAATLASTGTAAYFVHPAEAGHGDMGMIGKQDAILALSWSGETAELAAILYFAKKFDISLLGITSGQQSTLAKASDILFLLPTVEEACPLGLAPTSSTLIQMALGDALAVALLELNGFTTDQFRHFHPGGTLGSKLATIEEIMHQKSELPLITTDTPMKEAIIVMTEKSFGCAGVINENGDLTGIITDGDLRRYLSDEIVKQCAGQVMTPNPISIQKDMLATKALTLANEHKVTALFVTENNKPVGLVHMHDLVRLGIK